MENRIEAWRAQRKKEQQEKQQIETESEEQQKKKKVWSLEDDDDDEEEDEEEGIKEEEQVSMVKLRSMLKFSLLFLICFQWVYVGESFVNLVLYL